MPDEIHAAELRVARAEARVEALEQKSRRAEAREAARAARSAADRPGRSRLARGLDATTNPKTKENDR